MSPVQIIIGLLISAIVALASIMGLKYVNVAKAQNDIQELTTLSGATAKLATNIGTSFSGYTEQQLAELNFFPSNRVSGYSGSYTIYNQWKGKITAAADGVAVAGANDALAFTYTGVPTDACLEIVQGIFSSADKIVVAGTTVKSLATPKLNTANVATACKTGADNVSITYSFTR